MSTIKEEAKKQEKVINIASQGIDYDLINKAFGNTEQVNLSEIPTGSELVKSEESFRGSSLIPDVGKKVLAQKQINELIQGVSCEDCLHKNDPMEEYPCSDCDDFDRFNANLEYINKVNKLLEW
jgi:hypothetical protein